MKSKLKTVALLSTILAAAAALPSLAQPNATRVGGPAAVGGADLPAEVERIAPSEIPPVEPPQDDLVARSRDRIGPAIGPGEVGPLEPIQPIGPEIDSGVYEPLDFTIPEYTTTEVSLRWWNRGAPQTKVMRSINGGGWAELQTIGPLPADAYIDFRDQSAAGDAENCYRVIVSDGVGRFPTQHTPIRCAMTRDGRNLGVHRLQLRLRVADVADAGTDDGVQVRLQAPSWYVPTVTNWSPAGNNTWLDSTVDDFERGSNVTYDLLLTNVSEASDVTQVVVAKPGDDELCISEVELLVNGQRAFLGSYGDDGCREIGGDVQLAIDFAELRSAPSWRQMGTVEFAGHNGDALRSIIQAQFGHFLHGQGRLRNGGRITTTLADDSRQRLHVTVPIVVHDVAEIPVGGWEVPLLGDVESTVSFDMVLSGQSLSIENVDADSGDLLGYFLPIIGWKILYEVSQTIESRLEDMSPTEAEAPEGFHPCFGRDQGITICLNE